MDILFENRSVKDINNIVKKVSNKEKMLNACIQYLNDNEVIEDEKNRINIIKTIVALLPESVNLIQNLLSDVSKRINYEIHFSLFCYLDDIFDFARDKKVINNILSLTKNYLMNAKYNHAMAAWMAGDFLGDHWKDKEEALNTLTAILQDSNYIVGKLAALHGLEQLLIGIDSSKKEQIEIILKSILIKEKSRKVKERIVLLLK